MPRTGRSFSGNGFYHIVVRGADKLTIFRRASDYTAFLDTVFGMAEENGVSVIAYCLMSDHAHLLIRDNDRKLSGFMSRVLNRYAHHYNSRYNHTGRVFYDRFYSKCIDTSAYLLEVYRYILKNPEEDGVCRMDEYRWSSYWDYCLEEHRTDIGIIRSMLPIKSLHDVFLRTEDTHNPYYYENRTVVLNDQALERKIKYLTDVDDVAQIGAMSREERNEAIRKLRSYGMTINEISRVTGISRSIIQRAAVLKATSFPQTASDLSSAGA